MIVLNKVHIFFYMFFFHQQWNQCTDYQSLKAQLHSFLKAYVPVVFKPSDVHQAEGTNKTQLLSTLEWFIFGGEPKKAIEELKKNDIPSQLCGHVFKSGEPNYSCRYLIFFGGVGGWGEGLNMLFVVLAA